MDNDWLKFLWTDWLENLSDNFTLKQIVKRTVQSEKSWVSLTGFKTYFEHWHGHKLLLSNPLFMSKLAKIVTLNMKFEDMVT